MEKYETLKQRIVGQYEDSQEQKVTKVLEDLTLGDRRPSDLPREMQKLAGNNLSDDALRSIFLKRLPEAVGAVLVGSSETLHKLGELADRVHRYVRPASASLSAAALSVPTPTIAAVRTDESSHLVRMMTTLTESVAALANRVAQIEVQQGKQHDSRS